MFSTTSGKELQGRGKKKLGSKANRQVALQAFAENVSFLGDETPLRTSEQKNKLQTEGKGER